MEEVCQFLFKVLEASMFKPTKPFLFISSILPQSQISVSTVGGMLLPCRPGQATRRTAAPFCNGSKVRSCPRCPVSSQSQPSVPLPDHFPCTRTLKGLCGIFDLPLAGCYSYFLEKKETGSEGPRTCPGAVSLSVFSGSGRPRSASRHCGSPRFGSSSCLSNPLLCVWTCGRQSALATALSQY